MVHLKFPRQYAPRQPVYQSAPRPDFAPSAHSPLPSRYTREQALGTKFELWVEGLLKDNGYSFVRQNIVFTRERYEKRQVDVDYLKIFYWNILPWPTHTIVECKYRRYGAVKLELRREKEKRRQLLPHIETILEELEERRQFVKADKAILLTNQYFQREVYEESKHFPKIKVYDRCWLKQLDKDRRSIFSGFFQRKTIEQQVAEMELPKDKRAIWVKV